MAVRRTRGVSLLGVVIEPRTHPRLVRRSRQPCDYVVSNPIAHLNGLTACNRAVVRANECERVGARSTRERARDERRKVRRDTCAHDVDRGRIDVGERVLEIADRT